MTTASDTPVGKPSPAAIARRTRDLYIGSFSDVHLGHGQTPTSLILHNLRTYGFPDNAETGELDLIFLGGDLFDEGLMYFDNDIVEIELWMYGFLRMCERRRIVLRVLEGTPSHDRKQSTHFEKLLKMHDIQLDFKYVTEISVERIESLGISVLYVPDFTSPDTDKIWQQVQQAMAEAGVERVDYANIHGAFTYQMPPIESVQNACHVMDRYLSIVDNYIFTGHIHLPSVYDRILSNGSFDRLAHGEEEPKGHWRAWVRKDGQDRFVFRINQGARVYRTLNLLEVELDEALRQIDAIAAELPPDSAVRLRLSRGSPVLSNLSRLRTTHHHIVWSTKTEERADVQKSLLVDQRSHFTEITLTPENVADILM